ncbi:MAG: substrate-binding domain-containing protein [Methanobrevibacter sp.]|nr:substrate-binding domain-containing protein [Candidatus Methanovirga meridionalis]
MYVADSLNDTMSRFIKDWEPVLGFDINLTCKGSNALVKDITSGAKADVLLSADYTIIDDPLITGGYAKWNAEFARNSVVIAYRKNSTGSGKISADNWYEVLNQSDMRFGFGDPNLDPCGYRSVMVFALAGDYYKVPSIFNDLIGENTYISTKETYDDGVNGYNISSPSTPDIDGSRVEIDFHAADSLDALINEEIEYAFVYKNQAETAKYSSSGDIDYVDLPDKLSLNNTKYEDEYKHIILFQFSDNESARKTMVLTPIVYGLTQLANTTNSDYAAEFLDAFCAMTRNEDPLDPFAYLRYMDKIVPLVPSVGTNWDDVPVWMRRFM